MARDELTAVPTDPDEALDVWQQLVRRPIRRPIRPEVERAFAAHHDRAVRREVAWGVKDHDAMRQLLATDDVVTARHIARSMHPVPEDIADALATHRAPSVRAAWARSGAPDGGAPTVDEENPLVVAARIEAREVDAKGLERASRHEDHRVRAAVAGTWRLDPDVARRLIHDPDERVSDKAAAAIFSDEMRTEDVEVAMHSSKSAARERAAAAWAATTEQLAHLALDRRAQVLQQVASHANADAAVLRTIVNAVDWMDNGAAKWREVRRRAASNTAAPPDVLEHLATHEDPETRKRVATNRNAPLELLIALAADPDDSVSLAAADRANTPEGEAARDRAGHKPPNPDVVAELERARDDGVKGLGPRTIDTIAIKYGSVAELRWAYRHRKRFSIGYIVGYPLPPGPAHLRNALAERFHGPRPDELPFFA